MENKAEEFRILFDRFWIYPHPPLTPPKTGGFIHGEFVGEDGMPRRFSTREEADSAARDFLKSEDNKVFTGYFVLPVEEN